MLELQTGEVLGGINLKKGLIALVVLIGGFAWYANTRSEMTRKSEAISNAWSEADVVLRQRANIVREFERHALSEAFTVPLLWWNRIIVTAEKFKGWNVSPSHYIAQDLADVWLQD